MTEEELNHLVQEISLNDFKKPFCHQAVFNPRLKTTGGRYHIKDHHLDFNPKMLEFGLETFKGIIRHELCHYHLHLAGLPCNHRDVTFKKLLKEVGGLRYAPSLREKKTLKKIKYLYQCENCHQIYKRQRKIDLKHYVCGKCHGKLGLKDSL